MTQMERVADMLATANGQKAFIEWASSDLTMLMLSAARELAHPTLPQSVDAGALGMALGQSIGAMAVVTYLSSPFRARQQEELASDYGMGQILKENGYGNS